MMLHTSQGLTETMMTYLAGIEAGGTKCIAVIGTEQGEILQRQRINTTNPTETIGHLIQFFQSMQLQYDLKALGIGSFGPVDLNPQSSTYGHITSTPKPGWQNTDIVAPIQQALKLPVTFDTDVNAAALGEHRWGNAQGLSDFVYLTIGTGIGGGGMINNKPIHGAMHAEMGHMFVPHNPTDDAFPGTCPYHQNCLEGLAAGPAIAARWQVESAITLAPDHPAWALEAHYLAYAAANLILTLSPQRIIFGGGVMKQPQLLPMIQEKTAQHLAGYLCNPSITQLNKTIVTPGLGDNAGACGTLALAAMMPPL